MSSGSATTQFGILGTLEVWRDGRPVALQGPRVRLLLALLLVNAGHLVASARLIDGLWGEAAPPRAANALQALVSRLRAALGPGLVEARSGGYRLAVAPEAVDALRFERLLAEGRAALAAGDPRRAAELLKAGLALWRGEPLGDLGWADVLRAEMLRLEELRLDASGDRIEAELAGGSHAGLVAELEALVAAYPLNERIRGLHMRALYASGRQADALIAYDQTRTLLREELGADPAPELQRLHIAILRRDASLEGAAAALPPTNLRAQPTTFVGREELLERLRELLDRSRLVTLVGPGGAGKTRLAAELAASERSRYADGVWMVELAPLSDQADLPQSVLAALGLRERSLLERGRGPVTEPLDGLLGALAGRRLLIVMDNCEHLVEAAARIADAIVGRCPAVRILATSREPLVVTGETLCPVPSLRLPPEDVAPEDAAGYAAVRLFLDRGSAARPDFALTAHTVAAVVQICRRLDGLPLAIELAAARLRSLSVAQVAERLDDRFALLTGGTRTALARHQTLRAVVDWSWELLDEPERALLRRLSVFAGGATLEAAERACAGVGLARAGILDILASLVDKSLVEADGVQRDEMRYRLLDTVRAYGAERLREAGETTAVGRAHAEYFCDLAERAEPELRARNQLTWLARLDAEHDNLRAALRWAVDSRDTELAMRLFGALAWYWSLRGRLPEGRSWLRSVMAMPGEVPALVRARADVMAGLWSWAVDSPEAAVAAAGRARALYKQSGQPPHPLLLVVEPLLALLDDDVDRARALADAVLADAGAGEVSHATALLMIGIIESLRGEMDNAERASEEAVVRFRELGERAGLAQALASLAEIAEARGDHHRALAVAEEAVGLARELGAPTEIPVLLAQVGSAQVMTGEVELGLATAEDGLRLAMEGGIPDVVAPASVAVAALARSRGDLARARQLYEEAARTAPEQLAPMRARALVGLGFVAELEGDPERAASLHRQAVEVVRAGPTPSILWNRLVLAQALTGLAAAAAAQGSAERAAVLLSAASSLRGPAPLSTVEQGDIVRVEERARRDLGAQRFKQARNRGAAMSREEVLAYLDD
ncbi:MAG TPA: BTAD domain-containing putative transcriptional regulator [Candidatus Dormibacteraeota bacterium]|nr:BTAD domain-containing putative transcriptional regulator [Candidatus Dormibacteraeota bacterium]